MIVIGIENKNNKKKQQNENKTKQSLEKIRKSRFITNLKLNFLKIVEKCIILDFGNENFIRIYYLLTTTAGYLGIPLNFLELMG